MSKKHQHNGLHNATNRINILTENFNSPNYYDIQLRAYYIHEQKGGSDLENWLEAEEILKEGNRSNQGRV